MNNKQSVARIAGIAVLVMVLLVGCGKKDWGVYDATVPEDQLCTLEIAGCISVKEFDNVKVGGSGGWRLNSSSSKKFSKVQIPAGKHDLKTGFSLSVSAGYDTTRTFSLSEPMELSMNFQPGKTYQVTATLHLPDGGQITEYSSSSKINSIKTISMRIAEKPSEE